MTHKIFLLILFMFITNTLNAQEDVDSEPDITLEELIIQIKKIDSKWTKIFKKPKFSDWSASIHNQPLTRGSQVITKYTTEKELQFNGISFLLVSCSDTSHNEKKLKPIVYKVTPSGDTISLISDNYVQIGNIKNKIHSLRRNGSKITFEFNHLIEISKNESFYIGFEFINSNEPNNINDCVIFAPLRSKDLSSQEETRILKGESYKPNIPFLYKSDDVYKSGLYFELKLLDK